MSFSVGSGCKFLRQCHPFIFKTWKKKSPSNRESDVDSCRTEALKASQTSGFSESEGSPRCSVFTRTFPDSMDLVPAVGSLPEVLAESPDEYSIRYVFQPQPGP